MNESWYEVIAPGTALTQGDLIVECPLLTWNVGRVPQTPEAQDPEYLKREIRAFKADVVTLESPAVDQPASKAPPVKKPL